MKHRFLPIAALLSLLPVALAAQTPAPQTPPPTPAPADAATPAPAAPGAIPAPPDVAAPPADAVKTASGLASKVLTPGTGTVHPTATDRVKVHYTGWTTDGKMFDSSVVRGKPAVLPLDKVISGWGEGLQLMVQGEKRRLWIPANLAYEGRPGKPQGMLVFDVELLDILKPPPSPPPAPPDVAAPPADAVKTSSGLSTKVLTPGSGTRHPKEGSTVKVNYTGWTTDGKMFDSSLLHGGPATFNLQQVIPGWTEGLQLMTPGETRRFWVPERLAYKGKHGFPAGTLVFDVELIEIVKE
jgi:peptidylprolyl isomerase